MPSVKRKRKSSDPRANLPQGSRDVHLMLSARAGRVLHSVLTQVLENGACSADDKAVITAIQRDLKDHF